MQLQYTPSELETLHATLLLQSHCYLQYAYMEGWPVIASYDTDMLIFADALKHGNADHLTNIRDAIEEDRVKYNSDTNEYTVVISEDTKQIDLNEIVHYRCVLALQVVNPDKFIRFLGHEIFNFADYKEWVDKKLGITNETANATLVPVIHHTSNPISSTNIFVTQQQWLTACRHRKENIETHKQQFQAATIAKKKALLQMRKLVDAKREEVRELQRNEAVVKENWDVYVDNMRELYNQAKAVPVPEKG